MHTAWTRMRGRLRRGRWSRTVPAKFWHIFWFPFFFAVAFGIMFSVNVGHASPHAVELGIVAGPSVAQQVRADIERVQPTGIRYRSVPDRAAAERLIERNEIAAVLLVADADGSPGETTMLASIAASGSRAIYLRDLFESALSGPVRFDDLVPASPGDMNGIGLFFISLPLQVLGLISTAILQASGVRSWRWRLAWIAVYGSFAALFSYGMGRALELIPSDSWLPVLGFVLTQTISWIAISGAVFLRHFFMPVMMPFIVIFEVPISGGPMAADMMPAFSRLLHAVLPFSQYLDAARLSAYFGGAGIGRPLTVLFAWTGIAVALVLAAMWKTRRDHHHERETGDAPAEAPGGESHGSAGEGSGMTGGEIVVRGATGGIADATS